MVGRRRTCGVLGGLVGCVGGMGWWGKGTYRPAVADGPADDTPRVAARSDFEGEDLGRVEPGHGQPCCAEDHGVEEHKENGAAAHAGVAFAFGLGVDGGTGETTGAEHADALADGAPVERPAAANSIESEDADESRQHVCDVIETGNPKTLTWGDAGDCENFGAVDGDAGDADPFLENLQPDDELDAAARVQLAGIPAKEHG